MTKIEFENALEVFRSNAQAYAGIAQANSSRYSISGIVGDRRNVEPFVIADDWSGLSSYCQTKMAEILGTMSSLVGEQHAVNGLYSQLWPLKPSFSDYVPRPDAAADWLDQRTIISTGLINGGRTVEESEKFLSWYGKNGGQRAFKSLVNALDQYPILYNYSYERNLSLFAYYYHAKAVAEYNLQIATPQALSYNVTSKINSLKNQIKYREGVIFTKTKNNDFPGLIRACARYSAWVDEKMQDEIVPILAHCHQERKAPGSKFTTDGRRAMKAGNLFQQAVYAKALFLRIGWIGGWHEEVDDPKELSRKAAKLSNLPVEIEGNVISVAKLEKRPSKYDGKDVVAQGELRNLSIVHLTATKVISTAELINNRGHAIKIVLPHFKLDSGGLVEGCYLKVSGTFRAENPEAGNQPAMSVARYPMTTLGKTSWNAWLRNQMRTIYEPIAHNPEMMFSAEATGNGAINPVRFGTTCGKPQLFKITTKIN